jgi:hypothetical protein
MKSAIKLQGGFMKWLGLNLNEITSREIAFEASKSKTDLIYPIDLR